LSSRVVQLFAGNGAGQLNSTGSSNFFGLTASLTQRAEAMPSSAEAGRNNIGGANNSIGKKTLAGVVPPEMTMLSLAMTLGRATPPAPATRFSAKGDGDNTPLLVCSLALWRQLEHDGRNNSSWFCSGRLTEDAFNNSFFGFEAGEKT
jgi:hypothetical protein